MYRKLEVLANKDDTQPTYVDLKHKLDCGEGRVAESVPQLPGDMSEFSSGTNVRTTFYLQNYLIESTDI
jgi:hypothetical protein